MDERFQQLTDEVTDGLKADRELRLEVQRELTAHLEETAAYCVATGETEEAGVEHALRAFGPPAEVATGLATANRRRMKLRALVRLWLGTLIVPVAVIALLVVVYSTIYPLFTAVAGIDARPPLAVLESKGAREARLRSARLRDITQYRTLWEESRDIPAGKHYFAIYATYLNPLQTSAGARGKYGVRLPAGRTFEQEMRLGMQIDPDNAFYHYYLARYYLHQGVQVQERISSTTATLSPAHADDLVMNRQMVQRGVAEYIIGRAKPYLRTYRQDVMRERIALLPPAQSAEQLIRVMGMVRRTTPPEHRQFLRLGAAIGASMRMLAAEGRMREAEPLLQAWPAMGRQLIADASTFREVLAAESITRLLAEDAAAVYTEYGQPKQGAAVLAAMEHAMASAEPARKTVAAHNANLIRNYGNGFAMALDGGTPSPTRAQKVAAQHISWTIDYRLIIFTVLVEMVLVMTAAFIVSELSAAFHREEGKPEPILFMPTLPAMARILGYGVLLPLAFYFLYTTLPSLNGREHHRVSGILSLMDIPLLFCILTALPMAVTSLYIVRRCTQLGIPVPTVAERRRLYSWFTLFFVSAIIGNACSLFPIGKLLNIDAWIPRAAQGFVWFLPCLIVAVCCIAIWRHIRRQYPLYSATNLRLLYPIYALSILVLALVGGPYYRTVEHYWMHRNTLVLAEDGTLLPTQPGFESMRTAMLLGLDDLPTQPGRAVVHTVTGDR